MCRITSYNVCYTKLLRNEPDEILAQQGLGRAHHRVIYFVGRQPGISVSDLLSTLRITKQSLSRVLSQLLKEDYIHQRPGLRDRRQRLLELSPRGVELERQLTENQRKLLARAYREAGAEAVVITSYSIHYTKLYER